MTPQETLKVIEGLISEGKVNGHIDLIDMVSPRYRSPRSQFLLSSCQLPNQKPSERSELTSCIQVLSIQMPNLRNQVYERAIKVGKQTLPQTHAALIRMKL